MGFPFLTKLREEEDKGVLSAHVGAKIGVVPGNRRRAAVFGLAVARGLSSAYRARGRRMGLAGGPCSRLQQLGPLQVRVGRTIVVGRPSFPSPKNSFPIFQLLQTWKNTKVVLPVLQIFPNFTKW
jgi:hypothetical protein